MVDELRPNRSIKRYSGFRSWLLALVAIGLLAAFIVTSPTFRGCMQQTHDNQSILTGRGWIAATCVGRWVDENGNDIAAIGTLLIALFTLTLWNATSRLWRSAEDQLDEFRHSLDQARNIADQHAEYLGRSVNEAARAASAMEIVATNISQNVSTTSQMAENQKLFWKMQMRAYLSATFGAVVPQDNKTRWRTEVRLLLVNHGHTPAHDVSYAAVAEVLPFPLPDNFEFPIPTLPISSISVIGAGQNIIMSAALKHLISDSEIAEYTTGAAKRVYMWGVATYRDHFGDLHSTKFCQSIVWLRNGTNMSVNTRYHNESD